MPRRSKPVTITIIPEHIAALDRLARERVEAEPHKVHVSRSELIREAVAVFLRRETAPPTL